MIEHKAISTMYGAKDYMPILESMVDSGWYIIAITFSTVVLERVSEINHATLCL